jgi:hypothetical protein
MSDRFFDDDVDGRRGHALRRASIRQWNKGIEEDSMPQAQLEIREVLVGRTNGHGFQTSDGEWINISKFARAEDVALPRAGERVQVSLDRSGFVRKIATVAPPAPELAATQPSVEASPTAATHAGETVKDVVVTRLAVLNTATAILSSGGRVARFPSRPLDDTIATELGWRENRLVAGGLPVAEGSPSDGKIVPSAKRRGKDERGKGARRGICRKSGNPVASPPQIVDCECRAYFRDGGASHLGGGRSDGAITGFGAKLRGAGWLHGDQYGTDRRHWRSGRQPG